MMKKYIFIFLGTLTLVIGSIGIVLPILPTTPFLLLTLYFYAKGSYKFEKWFKQTKLYRNHLETFVNHRAMYKRDKWMLLIFVDLIILTSIFIINQVWVTILLLFIDFMKYVYFIKYVNTIPNTPKETIIQYK